MPVTIVRPSIIESALRRAAAGLDPRLPHGRAGDHLLRARPAEGVPRRARGHRRRDPRRPRRRRDHRRGRRRLGPEQAPPIVQVASGSAQPVALPRPRRPRARSGSASTRSTTRRPADRGRAVVVPRPWHGAGPARRGPRPARAGREGVSTCSRCAASRPSARAPLEERRDEVERALELRRAVRRVRGVRGDLRRRPPARGLGSPRRRRPRRLLRSTRVRSTGTTTSPTCTCRPSCSTPGCARRPAVAAARLAKTGCARAGAVPERHLAAFDLENTLIASNVVASYAWLATRRLGTDDRLRFVAKTLARGADAARARPQGPGRLPPLLLPALRGRARRAARRGRRRDVQRR